MPQSVLVRCFVIDHFGTLAFDPTAWRIVREVCMVTEWGYIKDIVVPLLPDLLYQIFRRQIYRIIICPIIMNTNFTKNTIQVKFSDRVRASAIIYGLK